MNYVIHVMIDQGTERARQEPEAGYNFKCPFLVTYFWQVGPPI